MGDELIDRLKQHQADVSRALRCMHILAVAENTTVEELMTKIIEVDDDSAALSQ